MKLTADTITDEQILALRAELLSESGNQMTCDTDATGMALADPEDRRFERVRDVARVVRAIARERCAEILNARDNE